MDKDHAAVNGHPAHRSQFAYVGDPADQSTWKLPIHDAAHIRNALARFSQTELPANRRAEVARRLVRAAKAHGIDASGFEKQHLGENSRYPAPKTLLESGSSLHASEVQGGLVRVAVAYTGEFNQGGREFSISEKDLRQMADNLNRREVPLDYEHLSGMPVPPGWSKAAGWLRGPASVARGILWAWAEFTPACLAAVRQKEYRYFSPEIHWQDTDEQGRNVGTRLAAGAITNRPFLKDLPPIEISETDYPRLLQSVALSESKRLLDPQSVHVPGVINSQSENPHLQKEGAMKNFTLKRLTDGEHEGQIGVFDGEDLVGFCDPLEDEDELDSSPEDGQEDSSAEDEAENIPARKASRAVKALSEIVRGGRLDLAKAEQFASRGELTVGAFLRAQKIERLIEQAARTGKILPKQRAAIFSMALADYGAAEAFLREARPVVDLRAHGISGEGSSSGTAREELEQAVTAYMTEHQCDRAQATRLVTLRNPRLWERHKRECAVRSEEHPQ